MKRGAATAAVLAGLMLGAAGALAQSTGGPTSRTTNTYDASSTSDDIRISCKELDIAALPSVTPTATLSAMCNKADSNGDVSAVSTTIDMLDYAGCQAVGRGYRVGWGSSAANVTLVNPIVLLTSTGNSYVFGGRCADSDGTLYGTQHTGMDIGETTGGLENDGGSLDKR